MKDEEYFLKTDSSGPSRRHAAALHNVLNHRVSHLLNNTISSEKCVNVAARCCYVNQCQEILEVCLCEMVRCDGDGATPGPLRGVWAEWGKQVPPPAPSKR